MIRVLRANKALPWLAGVALCLMAWGASAQSYCASDGHTPPSTVLERFMDANCLQCWRDPQTQIPAAGAVVLDWVVPNGAGDNAAMAAVATRDALERLRSLRLSDPSATATLYHSSALSQQSLALRVAHGLPVNDYIGTSISLAPGDLLSNHGAVTAWLLLVEDVPAGTADSPVARFLVRNALVVPWQGKAPARPDGSLQWYEARSMQIPEGANPQKLHLVGLLEDSQGHLIGSAASKCIADAAVAADPAH